MGTVGRVTAWTAPEPAVPGAHHLPAGAHVGDRRGLTATGAVLLALALGLVGAVVDVKTGSGLRTVFSVCFVTGSVLAALLVHREDLLAAVSMPPLTYCVLALIGGAISSAAGSGSLVKRQGLELLTDLVVHAPVLFLATGLAMVIAVVRRRTASRHTVG